MKWRKTSGQREAVLATAGFAAAYLIHLSEF